MEVRSTSKSSCTCYLGQDGFSFPPLEGPKSPCCTSQSRPETLPSTGRKAWTPNRPIFDRLRNGALTATCIHTTCRVGGCVPAQSLSRSRTLKPMTTSTLIAALAGKVAQPSSWVACLFRLNRPRGCRIRKATCVITKDTATKTMESTQLQFVTTCQQIR